MSALEVPSEMLALEDRPTLVPEARDSGVRLKVAKVAYGFATVDVVTCDLTRDPRSELYREPARLPPPPRLPSNVRALR